MRLHKGLDVTSDIKIQHPSPLRRQKKGGVNPPETISGGRGSDVTASTKEELIPAEAREPEARNPGGLWSVWTLGEEVGQQQMGAVRRSICIAG